ncbi:AlpA family phage regulatory protein [Halomonas sp. HK25]|uniref:AlpA family phage regulatory protein n=1 Tax=Halomonas sp. HK25 TaxID=3394321 RepID=UPI0039FD3AAC
MKRLSQREVLERCALSRTSLHRLVKVGAFPAPTILGGRTVVWTEAEIDQWIMRLIREQRGD